MRINLILKVFLLYRGSSLLKILYDLSKKRSRGNIEKMVEQQKWEQSSDQRDCYSSIVFPKQKRMKLMKGNMIQSDDVMVPNIRVRKFQIDPQKFEKFAAEEVFSDSDETEEESEEDDDDIDYDQVPFTRKFKVITWENNSSNMFYILNELAFNGDSSPDEVRQRIWDWESKHNDYYQQYLTEKIDVHIEKILYKIVWGTTLE